MADAHDDVPGELPNVRDEAADTPMWVPAAGLALLILGALFLVYRSATEEPVAEETVVEAADAEAAEGEEAEAAEE